MGCCKHVNINQMLNMLSMLLLTGLAHPCRSLSPDGTALLQLKRTVVDAYNTLSSWSAADDVPCTWRGVTCSASTAQVTALDLSHFNLSGSLPAFPTFPPSLSSLNLCCNSFSGPLSASLFSNLSALTFLDISHNFFIGPFPSCCLPRSLLSLSAFSNNFTGPLPLNFSLSLPFLRLLDLAGSFFSGAIPPDYGHFPFLSYLSLSGNFLTGPIPPQLGNLSQLTHLVLGYNSFGHTPIPPQLGHLHNLLYLDLCCSSLSGIIPPQLGSLTSLDTLFLYANKLVGGIPLELGNMSSVMSFDVSNNSLSGSVPLQLGKLQKLTLLSLMCNNLSGALPIEIGRMRYLLTILVWNNSLSGSLPPELGKNSPLQWVDVSSNMFSGPIPPDLCFKQNLTKLIIFSNKFTGNIPDSLAKCQTLQRVRMQDNQLTSSIPEGFGSLMELTRLELQINQLNGKIPSDVSFSATLAYLDVSYNSLEGTLPPNLWSLSSIQALYAAGNKLTGNIPSGYGKCPFLTNLDLSQNLLSGNIPEALSNCQKLTTIQLQQNFLSGDIPSKLAHLPQLEFLDFSHNMLTGFIPQDFKTIPSLKGFNVSYNNLSGVLPSEGIFMTASPSSFVGNPGLMCGGILGPCSEINSGYELTKRVTWSLEWLLGCVLFIFTAVFLFVGWRYVVMRYGPQICHKEMEENLEDWPWRLTAFQRLCFSCNDVLEALKEENIVGRGGTGVVYKVEMPSGDVVAVKRLFGMQRDTHFEKDNGFRGEIDLLGSIRHRNIVRLLGYCSNNVNTLLVYEYMPNGSLGDALHSEQKSNVLADWMTRYNIAVGIAQGLCYLHHDCFPQVIHRDVKSNNILLDAHLEARVADFGVAKLIETNDSMSMIAGSYGYIAPEYAYTLKVNEKTDIYSFGVVLLELLTGRRPVESEYGDAVNIVEWVRAKMQIGRADCNSASAPATAATASCQGLQAPDLLDCNVGASCWWVREEMLLVLRIALLCTSRFPRDRPSMRDVITMLAEAKPRRKLPSSSLSTAGEEKKPPPSA
ncbi:hypothetical protein GOP47_0001672 [Adiantum capillus-veneris]|uniref:non-specific serine/threonine protein kinase n=1 Tax=Adiantum capillus-veneris TaxID=13818 RepID=A0A9D4V8T9_ADICA|nr:hypothetical protein GOP47_0001672 [Adiantum capillus-veneris]